MKKVFHHKFTNSWIQITSVSLWQSQWKSIFVFTPHPVLTHETVSHKQDQWKVSRRRDTQPSSFSSSELLDWLIQSLNINPGNVSDEKGKYQLWSSKSSFEMCVKFWLNSRRMDPNWKSYKGKTLKCTSKWIAEVTRGGWLI